MAKLKIRNVGPIKQGYTKNDGFIPVNKLTVFIGNQGAGKSTVAKIYSTMSWIEKALVRGDFSLSYLSQYNRFKKQLAYQNIGNYISDKSIIHYIGDFYRIIYENNKLTIKEVGDGSNYAFPKIMYVPAERNFVSSVERPDLLKRLPLPLYTFLEEYEEAKKGITESISLPIGNLKFEYRKQNKKSWIVGADFKVELTEASSGIQSFVPLFIVTKKLAKVITKEEDLSHRKVSLDEKRKIRKEIDKIFSNKNISDEIKRVLLEKLSSRYEYSCFINIVEEPEQNLYPLSQKNILFDLLEVKNIDKKNQLVITTHSPYIINYLTLAIKGYSVKEKITESEHLEMLKEIVPLGALISPDNINLYQLNDDGSIDDLDNYNGLPSDENFLNEFLAQSNELFVKLMEIEALCQ